MKAAIPAMKANQWGRIINIASAHGLVASPYKVAYVAAKHAGWERPKWPLSKWRTTASP